MKILSLNCRGCGKSETVPELRYLVNYHRPDIIFLMETKMSKEKCEQLQWLMGFPHGLCVKSDGRSGGIALWWKREICVSLKSFAKAHIDVFISLDNPEWKEFRLTGFYGEPHREHRKDSWYLLKYLKRQFKSP